MVPGKPPARAPEGPPERRVTERARIRQALLDETLTARELSERAGVSERAVAEHLEHLARSGRARGERLTVEPARCLACAFAFRDRERLTKPGSCPGCRSTRIAPPRFRLEAA